jgi:23S rRNA pseudouridine1911/1915/1917 synthase
VAQSSEVTLLEIIMNTGVTHQIRVHLAAIGHPIVADVFYGSANTESFGLRRQFLHALKLEFRHPQTGRKLTVEAPLANDLRKTLRRLKIVC